MLTTKNWRAMTAQGLTCLAAALFFAGCTPAGPRALLDGERLLHEGKYVRAADKLEKATRLLPANAQAWNHLGLALHKAGKLEAAQAAYERARRCDANLTPVRYNLGCLLLEQNNPQAAAAELTTYTLLQHDSADGWLKLGTAQLRMRQWDPAERSFQNALRLRPDSPEALNGLGFVQLQRRKVKDALATFAAATQKHPSYAPAIFNEAVLYHHYLKEPSQALQKYREFLQLEPASSEASAVQENMRQLQSELSPPARREATNVVSVPSVPAAGLSNVAAHARSATNLSSQRLPPNQLAVAQLPPNQNKAAPPVVQSVPSVQPRNSVEPSEKSETPAPSEHHSTVSNARKSPIPSDSNGSSGTSTPDRVEKPTPPEVVRIPEGTAPKLAQDSATLPSQPVATPEKPPESRPVTSAPVVKSTDDEARALLSRKLAEEVPVPPAAQEKRKSAARFNPANWFRGKKQPDQTVVDAAPIQSAPAPTAMKSSPEPASISIAPMRRYAYHSPRKPGPGNRQRAEPIFAEAVQAHRDGRISDALEAYGRTVKMDPSFFEAQYNLGLAAYELKDYPKSLSAYETALSINPTSVNARYNFSLALQQAAYYEDAARELEKLLEQNPDETRAHLSLASLYAEKLGEPAVARPHYRKVLELEPQHPQAPAIRYWLAANP